MLQQNPQWFDILVPAYPGCHGILAIKEVSLFDVQQSVVTTMSPLNCGMPRIIRSPRWFTVLSTPCDSFVCSIFAIRQMFTWHEVDLKFTPSVGLVNYSTHPHNGSSYQILYLYIKRCECAVRTTDLPALITVSWLTIMTVKPSHIACSTTGWQIMFSSDLKTNVVSS